MRTREEALKHILSELLAGNLGARVNTTCKYSDGRICCSIGCLFTPAQRRDIIFRGLNTCSVGFLAEKIGVTNIETVTGLTIKECGRIQGMHDTDATTTNNNTFPRLRKYLEEQLEK